MARGGTRGGGGAAGRGREGLAAEPGVEELRAGRACGGKAVMRRRDASVERGAGPPDIMVGRGAVRGVYCEGKS